MLEDFEQYLFAQNKSENTVKGYIQSIKGFLKWFNESKDLDFTRLHRENVREYISFLKTVKHSKPKTINTKLNGLIKFNEFLIGKNVQQDLVITKHDYQKVQQQYASLAKVNYKDVEKFRQLILDSGNKRNYAIITIMAYGGLRISETLNIKMNDFNLVSRELTIRGKGDKTRIVLINDKVKSALQAWLKVRKDEGVETEFLFYSNQNKPLNRTTINKLFNDHWKRLGKEITPHDLRHFFCSHALESGMSVHHVASQAGHSNIHTTLLYTNPTKEDLIELMNRL